MCLLLGRHTGLRVLQPCNRVSLIGWKCAERFSHYLGEGRWQNDVNGLRPDEEKSSAPGKSVHRFLYKRIPLKELRWELRGFSPSVGLNPASAHPLTFIRETFLMDRDYGEYREEKIIIAGFEKMERESDRHYGETWKDFGPWFMVYRVGWWSCYLGE